MTFLHKSVSGSPALKAQNRKRHANLQAVSSDLTRSTSRTAGLRVDPRPLDATEFQTAIFDDEPGVRSRPIRRCGAGVTGSTSEGTVNVAANWTTMLSS